MRLATKFVLCTLAAISAATGAQAQQPNCPRAGTLGVGRTVEFDRRSHLDLEVAGRELDARAVLADQHVGEDRQRVPSLDDAGDSLQCAQKFFLRSLQDNHVIPFNVVVVVGVAVLCGERHFPLFDQAFRSR